MQNRTILTQTPLRWLLLLSPFFLWGTAMVAMKSTIPETTPLFLAGTRLIPAGILVLLVAAWQGRQQPQTLKAWLWIGLFAAIDGTLFQGFLAEGLVRTGAGLGSVMIDSQPIAVALLSAWLFGETIGWLGAIGLGLGVVGIAAIGLPDEWILGFARSLGNGEIPLTIADVNHFEWGRSLLLQLFNNGEWLMLLAALSMAAGTVSVRFVCKHVDPIVATGWHMILGGLPLWVLSGVSESQQWVNIDLYGWLSLGYATVFGSAIAYGVFFYFASQGNLTSLSALTFLTPVFALFFGNLLLSETLSGLQWAGVLLTLVSIYIINQREVLMSKLAQKQGFAKGDREPIARTHKHPSKPVELPVQIGLSQSETEMTS
ncbi:DMT family transporter [Oxynema aestuarii]|jgi:drug/metabolite transporter (DMT)-like permease|uniref:DMT family transporter n=1 Tax=Oxynema aestuarii AP17 TaxID=2064643 RepID=A0A6H1TT75_9CYAN|nr:DMT family transporter [Oxynema aestuarii]QIZ69416.1 DMT family transporter [Oxynema aestuarii AP17]